ncbi:MAG: excisionase family DNA-binding protein [Lachnospiraceae bacterium]|nr:excisionase family DNA-binding protein [Lachnospiraceae bacterium]
MTAEQINRYLDLVNRRLYILVHSGIDWKPEYETELQQIDREIAEMRPIVEQARKEKEQRHMTAEKKERYRALLERRRRAFDELQAADREILQLQAAEPEQYTEDGDKIPTMATIQEAANLTGLSYDYIRKLCIQGKIIYVQTGTKRLVNMDKLRIYLNSGEAGR